MLILFSTQFLGKLYDQSPKCNKTAATDVLKHATGIYIAFMCIHLHTPLNPVHMIFRLASFVQISARLSYESKIYLLNKFVIFKDYEYKDSWSMCI